MFKIKLTNNKTYAEEGQKNPIRWKTLFKQPDGTFIDQSGWIKCKDFFNDSLAYFKSGQKFSIYSYQNDIKKNDEGVYFLLKNITEMPTFLHNMNVVNVRMFKDLACEVSYWQQDKDEAVVMLPNELWESTYLLSLITMLVRVCNYGYKYETWEDVWHSQAPINAIEHSFTPEAKANAQSWGFAVPTKYKGYWYYCGKDHNSKTHPNQTGGVIHNNGVSNWSMFIKMEKA